MVARSFAIQIDRLDELGADLDRLARGGLREAILRSLRGDGGKALAAEMRLRAPKRTGTLRDNIDVHEMGGNQVLVGYLGADVINASVRGAREQRGAWVESGTRPHTIKAKDGKGLFFGGRFVEEVHHPGSKGQGIARKSIRAAEWEVLADVADKVNEMLNHGVGSG